ncbi:hypothetical protein [Microbacterium sp. Marseille-Q6965]|uniref:hypothetical protein n=1 Tax=Microbacterium sp. Marseille-Q6965 TaxID=2965072 RepID=UPI0021B7E804|nr:hypothetical protein [Microbacterium sp. Marseille-Q6965]
MPTIRRTRTLFALGALAVLPAALTACGGSAEGGEAGAPAATEQSVADACSIVTSGMTEVQSNVSEIMSSATSGDTEALDALISETSDGITALKEQVTNEEVGAAFTDFADAYQTIADLVPQLSDLDVTAPDASETASELSSQASEASTQLTDASRELTELCS